MSYKENYEGFEDLPQFKTKKDLETYRRAEIEKSLPQVEFIRRHCGAGPLGVVEVGCGNGRLLIALALKMLIWGRGLDLSKSRITFGRLWCEDLGIRGHSLGLFQGDALDEPPLWRNSVFDLAVCITGCFQYFKPMGAWAETRALNFLRKAGRKVLFELYKMPPKVKALATQGYKVTTDWQYLQAPNPWKYYLSSWDYDPATKIMTHEKTFVGHNGELDEGRVEKLVYYDMHEFLALLGRHGFKEVHVARENSESMVVLAS